MHRFCAPASPKKTTSKENSHGLQEPPPDRVLRYTFSGGSLFIPGKAFAAPEAIVSHLPLLTTAWGIAALLGLLLLFSWNRALKSRLAFLKKLNTALTRTTQENTERIRNAMDQINAVINTVPCPVFYKDRHGVYLGCNETFARMILGIPPEEIAGKALTDMPDTIPPELAKTYQAKDQELIDTPGTQFYEASVKCADGAIRDFFFSKATLLTPKGEVTGIAGVMLADVDGFRHINHLHGSTFGDRVLQRISRTIANCVREVDLVGRFGGDEFLVALPDTDLEEGKEVAERIRHSVESLEWKAAEFVVTVNIGVAAYDTREDNDPLKEADRHLSRARTRGANRIESD